MVMKEKDICRLIQEDEWMMGILKSAQTLDLPDWWVCAGFVRAKVWDVLHEYSERSPLPDIDVIYFDPTIISEEIEKDYENILIDIQPNLPWSVKNQARMHIVNNNSPYLSSIDAISKFPETATALGVKLDNLGEVVLTAPHGIKDVVNYHVKPTPYFRQSEEQMQFYKDRIMKKNWKARWYKVQLFGMVSEEGHNDEFLRR
ncbi:nucleotidyltransferase family protein [Sporosarcina sp. Sa2YVA2]|uniref:Nucleotidyltransferase family protein n=1 Tax=Sporosarcina quadrami TaxID=2762234 RepID=A0ABR8UEI5_9BACL|nr:nucleotidyltransferase family protein [Sporosarcina quadrami]MBD7986009.1 nucleotidyltransferase family protein [Sporosarcina quadrami]